MQKEEIKLNILVVEDNDADFRLTAEFLKEINPSSYEYLRARDLASALKAVGEFKFDAILMDLYLPDSQGLATVKEMCRYSPDSPLIVLTGLDDKKLGIESLKCGAQDYLTKGSARGELLEKSIYYAIERKQLDEDLRRTSQRLVAVLESLSDGFASWDRDWRLTYVNSAAERMFSQNREALMGQDVRAVFPWMVQASQGRLERSTNDLVPSMFEAYYPPSLIPVEVRVFPSNEGQSAFFRVIPARK
jgi:two-component system, cell cycle response regulator